jgi:tetratricopeptide (TPR) repeat protein
MALRADGPRESDPEEDQSELEALKEKAAELQEHGLWNEEALKVNREILDLSPDDMETATRLGRCVQGAGRPCEALELFDRVLASDPEDPVAQELRGSAAGDCALEREIDRLEEEGGLDAVREAAAAAGNSFRDLRFAVLARQRVADREPTAQSLGALAGALVSKGEIHSGEPLFLRSLELDPDPRTNIDSMLGHVAMLREQSRRKEAVEACERILAAVPDDVRTLKAATEIHCDMAETTHEWDHLNEANAFADRIWSQGVQDESVNALYERMQRIHASIR